MSSKILLIGGSGLVGTFLAKRFKSNGDYIGIIARRINNRDFDEHIEADTTRKGRWLKRIGNYEIIINLAGATIGKRWSKRYKREIYDSRILTTRNIVETLSKGQILFSTSATGYYGDCKDKILTEKDTSQSDFLSMVCKDWEGEAIKATDRGTKVYIMRFGVVAAKDGGAFIRLIKNHRLLLGSVINGGDQYFSSIHIEDIYRAITYLIDKRPDEIIYNFTMPDPVTNRELTYTIAKLINRPIIIPFIPAFFLRIILGEFANTLLFSQRVIPHNLSKIGFEFKYKTIEDTIKNIV
ncbi:MAG: TIGR01777 family oxidoreductase [Myxococcota bacterium]